MAPRNKAMRKKARVPPPPPPKRKFNRSMIIAIAVIAVIVIVFGVIVVTGQLNQPNASTVPSKVLLETTAGNITLELRSDKPITTANFVNLVKDGRYDGSTFHRVVAGFMIQGGKVSGDVTPIKDETGGINHNDFYTVAMAKTSQPNSATSEFFINVAENSYLDVDYTVFADVIAGKNTVDTIASAPVMANPDMPGENSLPLDPVVILHATILP